MTKYKGKERRRKTVTVWWKSRVLWVNALAGAVSAGVILFEPVRAFMPAWPAGVLALLLAAANAGLRFVTTDPISARQLDDRIDPADEQDGPLNGSAS